MQHLEDLLGLGQTTELVRAEIQEVDAGAADELAGDERHQDLAAVAHRHQPGRPVQRRTVVVAVAQLRSAGVHTHAHPQRAGLGPRFGAQRELRVDCRIHGLGRAREGGEEPVPGRLHHVPTAGLHGGGHHLVVTRQCPAHRVGMLLPQTRRPLEIGEQERHRPRRQLRHPQPFVNAVRRPR